MTIPPQTAHPARYFEELATLRQHLVAIGVPLDTLSMGMSGDFEAAVRAGATHVRIGTAIFGDRSAFEGTR
jgi:uncharacterized pyridoxal phosphate-containing UPF0001 family protein